MDNYAKTLENLESNLKSKYDDHNYSMDKKTQQLSVEDNNLQILETANILPDSKKQKLEDNTLKNENMQTPNNNITSANNIINYHEILENQDKSNEKEETAIPVSKTIKNTNHKKINSIMVYYNEYNKRKEWPKKSSINCFWCCHTFTCPPCVLPTKLKGDVFHVYGNFCSKECAGNL